MKPLIFKSAIDSWPASKWTPDTIVSFLHDQKVQIRLGKVKYSSNQVQWENECNKLETSVNKFVEWMDGKSMIHPHMLHISSSLGYFLVVTDFCKFPIEDYWGYLDYKTMFDLFADDVLKQIDWSIFGEQFDGFESTFWFGSCGAFTPCHYDSYGFNLVAQIYGRKRWILFPPDDSKHLQPTRLPYEESSIFSSLDIFSVPKALENTYPHIVELEPGDVLFVPRHWWHFVECLSTSISVNTWIPIKSLDYQSQIDEAIVAAFVSQLDLTENQFVQLRKGKEIHEKIDFDKLLESLLQSNPMPNGEDDDKEDELFCKRMSSKGSEMEVCSYFDLKRIFEARTKPLSDNVNQPVKLMQNRLFASMTQPDVICRIRDNLLASNC